MKKELIVFIPSLQIGGVEKNFFILTNNLSKRLNISVITSTSKIKNNLNRNIKLICPNISFIEKLGNIFSKIKECEDGADIQKLLEGPVCQVGFKRIN